MNQKTYEPSASGVREEAGRRFEPANVSLATRAEMEIAGLSVSNPLPPIHPGEVLMEDFLRPLRIGTTVAANRMGLPRTRIERVIRGEVGITADTALRLEAFLGAPAQVWLNLQNIYDLEVGRNRSGAAIPDIRPWSNEVK